MRRYAMTTVYLVLLLFLAISNRAMSTTTKSAPLFWVGKPKLEAKLRDERAVLVSVKSEKGLIDPGADLFSIRGVGWVRRDAETTFQLAKNFDRLKDVSDHFKEVKYDPKTQRVFVICQALGYQARMLFRVELRPKEIYFKVVDGHFIGLSGTMTFRVIPEDPRQTEVALNVEHEAREIPIPRSFVGIVLEVLVQRVAVKMRTHFETASLTGKPL